MIRNLLIAFAFAASVVATAQTPPTATLILPKTAVAGQTVKAKLRVTFAEGLHGYQNPPSQDYMIPVKVESAIKGIPIKVSYPKGNILSVNDESVAVYQGLVEIPVTITLPKKPGVVSVKLNVSYQQCTDDTGQCYPPDTVVATGKITVKKPVKKG